jgi:hypothetical protein
MFFMPYNNIDDFRAAVQGELAMDDHAYRKRNGDALDDQDIINAFGVYQAARHTNLQALVLGRWVQPSTEYDPGIDQTTRNNFHEMNEVDYGGSVMNSVNWTILMNDAWVLGGIHSHTPFYLASPRTQVNVAAGAPRGMTVTGRELIGVTTFGYEIVHAHASLGETARLAQGHANNANGATLHAYRVAVAAALHNGVLTQLALNTLTAPSHDISNEYAH